MSDKPVSVAAATYPDKDAAITDYEAIRHAKRHGGYDHLAIAVVVKGADGTLKVDRHDTSAHHLAWGGAILGATLAVLVPPIGFATLAGATASTAVLSGAGGIIGHFHQNIPKEVVGQINQMLESGDAGLIVVAVNPKGTDLTPLLAGAKDKIVVNDVDDDKAAVDNALVSAFEAPAPEEAPAAS
ncbi:hypothetical protein AAIB33_07470 [Microbacterium sp. AZCO]|uniref:hypothetical protein n=1 Tax=Microbacterium sp. AZCO TaxID=3142976 RepID=UPI0031F3C060